MSAHVLGARIRLLAPELVERIAAGEVIERPSSVVKELVENALDAGARRITVEVEGGGIRLIRVSDDGEGVAWEDGDRLFHRHATSKLAAESDLQALGTMGFRGEALASMGTVAEVEFVSRRAEEECGFRLLVLGGKREARERAARAPGTTVTVRRLFFNTPARGKFLRGEREEGIEAARVVTRYAMAYPGVAFRLVRDDRETLNLPAAPDHAARWRDLLGREEAEDLLPLEGEEQGVRVRGAASMPEKTRGTPTEMLTFVNGRLIQDRGLTGAAMAGYRGLLPPRRYPRIVLLLEIAAAAVDVNVHPAKREVRFARPEAAREAVRRAVARALVSYLEPSSAASRAREGGDRGMAEETRGESPHYGLPGALFPGAMGRAELGEATRSDLEGEPRPDAALFPLQVARTFLLDLDEEGLRLYDQHTAHERVLFEEALRRLAARRGDAQELLIPSVLTLTPEEEAGLAGLEGALAALGYTVSAFGPRTIAVSAYPVCLLRWDGGESLRRMLASAAAPGEQGVEAIAAGFACRHAVKAGQALHRSEILALVGQLRSTATPHLCPHGRPTMITISLAELRRRFRRE